jgi:hypothetical protein
MSARLLRLRGGLFLAVGLALGWILATAPTARLHAGGGDRPDAAIVATGPIGIEPSAALKTEITKDAVYYLNYSRGFLYAAVPLLTQTAGSSRILSEFGERDLLKDFGIGPGTHPHFAMTAGNLGASGDGWAALYVFETTTGQLAIYRAVPQVRAGSSSPVIQLVEKRADGRLAMAKPAVAAASR